MNKYLISFLISSFAFSAGLVTGPKNGTYYQMGKELASHVQGIKIKTFESQGTLDNLRILRKNRKVHFAFLQYDALFGPKVKNLKWPLDDIKLVYPLHLEELHFLTRKNSGIKSFKDLRGKKLNVGTKGSGTWSTAQIIKSKLKMKWVESYFSPEESLKKLLLGEVDAIFLIMGKPASIYKSLPKKAQDILSFIDIDDERLDHIYEPTSIKNGTYPWQNRRVRTFSTRAFLATLNYKKPVFTKGISTFVSSITRSLPTLVAHGHPKWSEVRPSIKVDWPFHPSAVSKSSREIIESIKSK